MASPVPHERALRKILIGTLLPAFPLIVASGIKSREAYKHGWYSYYGPTYYGPTLIFFGLIPAFISAITSVFALATAPDLFASSKRAFWRTGLWFLIDAFLALANVGVLLPVWIYEPGNLNERANWMMLETYATVFLIINMLIHAYLALYHPSKMIGRALKNAAGGEVSWGWRTECPHCHGKLGTTVETTGAKREGYSLLRAEQYLDEPEEGEASTAVVRESTDSEV